MASWHDDGGCSRLDLVESEGYATCLSCGSFRDSPAGEATLPSPAGVTQTYVYQPTRQRTEMRLFRLGPGEMDDPIRGDLVTIIVRGQDQEFQEVYDAISYTWADEDGDATKCFHALIGEACIPITRNCQAALRRVRSRYATKSIWIDSICINQANPEERGHQVDLMPYVYTRARSTFVYVGESINESHALLEVLKSDRVQYERENQDLRVSAARFLSRPYFSRIWVIQEIALSRTKTVLCGGDEIPWSVLEAGVNSLLEGSGNFPPLLSLGQRRLRDATELFGLLQMARLFKATDPRDKVFALLGLVIGAEAEGLIADYEKSPEEVYAWIARYLYRHQMFPTTNIFDNMSLMDWDAWSPDCPQTALPSWFPDWNNTGPTLLDHYGAISRDIVHYLASVTLQFDINDERALCLKGYFLGDLLRLSLMTEPALGLGINWLVYNNQGSPHDPSGNSFCECSVCSDLGPRVALFHVTTRKYSNSARIPSTSVNHDFSDVEVSAGRLCMVLYPVDTGNFDGTDPVPQSRREERFKVRWKDQSQPHGPGTFIPKGKRYAEFEPSAARAFKLVGILRIYPRLSLRRTQLDKSSSLPVSIKLF